MHNNSHNKAKARHILVSDESLCREIKKDIESGVDFSVMAFKHSQCPSGRRGGDLGTFDRGTMVAEFDQVVFNHSLQAIHGPIKTEFGFHLIEILERTS
ncbi:MAG: peptidylprolyl isomerase [Kangiellaceae bacterium]|nr:peptidylprolyl isomerase [Kangiellaceae bacterium]